LSWLSKKTGRSKEKGGHKRHNVSFEKFISDALKKVGNKSQFLESVARPVLKKLDPGEASVFLWQIDNLLSQGIIKATKEGNFEQVQALSWIADQLEDARRLCGTPQGGTQEYRHERRVEKKRVRFSSSHERTILNFINLHMPYGCSLITIQSHMVVDPGLEFEATKEIVESCVVRGLITLDGQGKYHLTAPLASLK
jgi:hypothetical protein